jgi:hypothetical protein
MKDTYAPGNARGQEQGNVQPAPEETPAESTAENQTSDNRNAVVPREELLKVIDERRKLKERLRRLEERLDEANKQQEEKRLRELSEARDFDHLREEYSARLNAVQQSARDWEERYRSERLQHSVLEEAARLNAYNPAQILRLVQPELSLDENGEPSFRDGRALAEGLREFCSRKENRNLLKPSASGGGAGSTPGASPGENSTPLEEARLRALQSGQTQDIIRYQKLKRATNKTV